MQYTPEKGDLVWLNFNPQSGHEQMGRRPAIVISNTLFNNKAGMAMVCPITNTKRHFPLHIKLENCSKIQGYIMVEQIKSIDYSSRNIEFIEKAPEDIVNEVLSFLYPCLF